MRKNHIDGKVLSCVVIPDFSKLHKLEWRYHYTCMRYQMFHGDPPLLRIFGNKSYYNEKQFRKALDQIDAKVDDELCRQIKASNLAFIVFDKVSVAKKIKDIVT
jgi:hypothetical protein